MLHKQQSKKAEKRVALERFAWTSVTVVLDSSHHCSSGDIKTDAIPSSYPFVGHCARQLAHDKHTPPAHARRRKIRVDFTGSIIDGIEWMPVILDQDADALGSEIQTNLHGRLAIIAPCVQCDIGDEFLQTYEQNINRRGRQIRMLLSGLLSPDDDPRNGLDRCR